jgi:hypothetical protein
MLQTGLRGTPHGEQIFEQFSQLILWPKKAHKGKNVGKVYEIINEDELPLWRLLVSLFSCTENSTEDF